MRSNQEQAGLVPPTILLLPGLHQSIPQMRRSLPRNDYEHSPLKSILTTQAKMLAEDTQIPIEGTTDHVDSMSNVSLALVIMLWVCLTTLPPLVSSRPQLTSPIPNFCLDPADPLLQAQVAELQRRVQNLNPLDFPLLPDSKSITSHSPVSQPPPPTQYPETIESPPRMPSNGHSLGEHTNNHDDVGLQGRANTNSNRRRLSSLFSDVKGKVTGKARESSPRSPPSREDPNKILRDLQAGSMAASYLT